MIGYNEYWNVFICGKNKKQLNEIKELVDKYEFVDPNLPWSEYRYNLQKNLCEDFYIEIKNAEKYAENDFILNVEYEGDDDTSHEVIEPILNTIGKNINGLDFYINSIYEDIEYGEGTQDYLVHIKSGKHFTDIWCPCGTIKPKFKQKDWMPKKWFDGSMRNNIYYELDWDDEEDIEGEN